MEGYFVIGYGASHSTGTLVHSFAIVDMLDLIVDENKTYEEKFNFTQITKNWKQENRF